MNRSVRFVLCCALCLALASAALAQKRRRPAAWGVPEVFSDLYLEHETGDVGGMEVILVPSYGGVWATLVVASGIAYEPVLVEVKVNDANIEFTLPSTEHYRDYGKFTGKISPAGLTLWNKGQRYGFLRRQRCSARY